MSYLTFKLTIIDFSTSIQVCLYTKSVVLSFFLQSITFAPFNGKNERQEGLLKNMGFLQISRIFFAAIALYSLCIIVTMHPPNRSALLTNRTYPENSYYAALHNTTNYIMHMNYYDLVQPIFTAYYPRVYVIKSPTNIQIQIISIEWPIPHSLPVNDHMLNSYIQ